MMLLNAPRLFDRLKTDGLDAIVATSPENVTYSSGYWAMSQWIRRGPQAYVLTPAAGRGDPCIIASTGTLDLIADGDGLAAEPSGSHQELGIGGDRTEGELAMGVGE